MTTLEKIFKKIDEIYIDIYGEDVDCNISETSPECRNCIECFRNRCKEIVKEYLTDDNEGWISVLEKLPDKPKENPNCGYKRIEPYIIKTARQSISIANWNGEYFQDTFYKWKIDDVIEWKSIKNREKENCLSDKNKEWIPVEERKVSADIEVCEECIAYKMDDSTCREIAKEAVKALEEVKEYRKIGTIEEVKEAVEKTKAKEPDYEGDGYADGEIVYDTWICPNCGERYEVDYDDYNHCPKCGQKIDRSDEE